jgi:3-dehydrosphinganine reductase
MDAAGASALVTGGSSGIGLAIAAELVAAGADVHLAARRPEVLESARLSLESARRHAAQRIDAHVCDVASAGAVAGLFGDLARAGATPSIVVNSAGISRPGCFDTAAIDDFEDLMRVNFMGTVHVLKHAVPPMMAKQRGHILNVASVAGLLGVFGMPAYCASKFAVRGLSETLRAELKPHGIHVSLLCPPDTDTPMLAAEAATKPAETAALSRAAGIMTAAAVARAAMRGLARGQATIVPGFDSRVTALAQRFAPGLVERLSDRIVRRAQSERGRA